MLINGLVLGLGKKNMN